MFATCYPGSGPIPEELSEQIDKIRSRLYRWIYTTGHYSCQITCDIDKLEIINKRFWGEDGLNPQISKYDYGIIIRAQSESQLLTPINYEIDKRLARLVTGYNISTRFSHPDIRHCPYID